MLYKLTCNLCLILHQQHFFGIAICTNIYHISTVGCELGIRAQGHSSWVLMQRRHDRYQPLAHPLQDFVLFGHLRRQMRGHGEHMNYVRKVKERTKRKGKERKQRKQHGTEQNKTQHTLTASASALSLQERSIWNWISRTFISFRSWLDAGNTRGKFNIGLIYRSIETFPFKYEISKWSPLWCTLPFLNVANPGQTGIKNWKKW